MKSRRQYIIGGFFLAIMLICLITLILPTTLVIVPNNDVLRGQAYIITVDTLTHQHIYSLPPSDTQLTAIEVGGFTATAFIQYPKYFIGLLAALAVAGAGVFCVGIGREGDGDKQA